RVVILKQEREATAVAGILQKLVERLLECRRIRGFTIRENDAQAIGVVKIEDRGLGMSVRRALADRMQRVAFDLGRAAVMRGRNDWRKTKTRGPRSGEEQRLTRNGPFHAARERHQMLLGTTAGTQTKTRQGRGRTHELEEITTGKV